MFIGIGIGIFWNEEEGGGAPSSPPHVIPFGMMYIPQGSGSGGGGKVIPLGLIFIPQ